MHIFILFFVTGHCSWTIKKNDIIMDKCHTGAYLQDWANCVTCTNNQEAWFLKMNMKGLFRWLDIALRNLENKETNDQNEEAN